MIHNEYLICGAFSFDTMATGGQPVKTRELYYLIKDEYGSKEVDFLEITTWKSNPLKLLYDFFCKAYRANNIIMLPAHNGVLVFSGLLVLCKVLFGKKIYYDVIGGWLAGRTKKKKWLTYKLKRFDGIWVETSSMQKDLENLGFQNVSVFKNFKKLEPVSVCEFINSEPHKLCTFSRVMKEKGITDAITAVQTINKKHGRLVYLLDIYGPVDNLYESEFEQLIYNNQECVTYKGIVQPQDSVTILKNYFALLFPTLFYTEGIPGTIIDAYFAGVPVIAAKWLNFGDVIDNGKTGYLYKFGEYDEFVKILDLIANNPEQLSNLKHNCIEKSADFSVSAARKRFIELTKI